MKEDIKKLMNPNKETVGKSDESTEITGSLINTNRKNTSQTVGGREVDKYQRKQTEKMRLQNGDKEGDESEKK